MANPHSITSIPPAVGIASGFEAYQLNDYVELRAVFAASTVKNIRLMATRDVHLHGELKLDTAGSLYADEFLGTKTVTDAPSDSGGEAGAHAIDTTNGRMWVKIKDADTNCWWYANLTDPGA